ncbi:MAG TPA: metallophosphoesterase [Longimicrobiaceae bacterium]|nr:metallophosphoesterase [Longimicrobiaceae bacterium]
MNPKTRALLTSSAAAAGSLIAYSFLIEPRWLEVTHTRIHIRNLQPEFEGLRLALLTDLHAGEGTPLSLIRRACRLALDEDPHMIAVTGDLAADDSPGFREVLAALSSLEAPLGVYAVPGNHDYEVGIDKWHRAVEDQAGMMDLTNRMVIRELDGARLCIAGVDDTTMGRPTLAELPAPDARDLTILLAHDPSQAERARRSFDSVDLVLSGHTHGGQIRLPWLGAVRNPTRRDALYEEGLRRRPWTQVYTSRGIGTVHIPARFLCRPEVAILQLTGAPRPAAAIV